MHLFIIRHCQSENNALWRRTGSDNGRTADPALTDLGHKQADVLAEFLASPAADGGVAKPDGSSNNGFGITHLYCSLMLRSVQTGTYIADALDLPLVGLKEIHERGGLYLKNPQTEQPEGLPGPDRDHFQANHPHLILPEGIGDQGWWNREYEDQEEAVHRARRFFTWLEEHHGQTEDRVAIVSHGGFIQSLFSVLLGARLTFSHGVGEREIWIKSNNGSISRVDFWPEAIRLTYLNRIEFFPPDLIS